MEEPPQQDTSVGSQTSPISITLTGRRGQQFDHLKGAVTRNLGYEPTNPEMLGILMATVGEERDEVDPE